MDVSIVVPIYNEIENVVLLYQEISGVIDKDNRSFEIIFVDDGSRDGTAEKIKLLAVEDTRVRPVFLRRNFGQTAAMKAGIDFANGDVIVTMDGDLQNDPSDIPMMLDKLDEGYDLVHGWRRHRKDKFLTRKLPSKIANWLISKTTGFPIHDLGCTLKVVRADIAKEIELYGEMHRFIPILADRLGAKCVEVETNHRARRFGETKYGLGRTTRVILDLITVKYILSYFASPMKIFGRLGLMAAVVSFIAIGCVVGMKAFMATDMTGNPLLMLSVISMLASIQFFGLGLLGEVNARIYFNDSTRDVYTVRETMNFDSMRRTDLHSANSDAFPALDSRNESMTSEDEDQKAA
ncbi:glycosyltransferase family 2 protein [Pirellulaceae bacterium]|jgi:glycosyltransferase involved in cell wall biosynthesis|nr:glycosyltransferase family 2 protein [Pirellulaceae bacterium]